MAQNELQIVTYEQAKRLKVAGFDWETDKYYDHEFYFEAPFDNHNDSQCFFSAPTVALALKWFRDVKGGVFMLGALIIRDVDGEMQISHKYALCTDIETDSAKREIFPTCEEAESALLGALLDSLEDK